MLNDPWSRQPSQGYLINIWQIIFFICNNCPSNSVVIANSVNTISTSQWTDSILWIIDSVGKTDRQLVSSDIGMCDTVVSTLIPGYNRSYGRVDKWIASNTRYVYCIMERSRDKRFAWPHITSPSDCQECLYGLKQSIYAFFGWKVIFPVFYWRI